MNNNELNALVAERVMNLRNVRLFMDSNMFVYDDIRTYAIDARGKETITYQPVPIPNYVNDIAAAWDIVEKMKADGLWCKISTSETVFGVTFYKATHQRKDGVSKFSLSAPRAICLAALKAVGVEAEAN